MPLISPWFCNLQWWYDFMYVITRANASFPVTTRSWSWKAVVHLDFLLHSLEWGSTHMIVHEEVLRGYRLDVDELCLCKCSKRKMNSITYFKSSWMGVEKGDQIFFLLHVLAAFLPWSKGFYDEDTTRKQVLRGRPSIASPGRSENCSRLHL